MMEQVQQQTSLESRTDEQLRDLIAKAEDILKTREEERLKDAVAQIKRIAKENGLVADVRKSARRASRKSKSTETAAD